MKIIFCLILFFYTTGFAQDAESVLKSLQNKFDSIIDLSADINQKSNGKFNLSGKMYFKKANNLRMEFGNQLIIADGSTTWNYSKNDKKVIISNYDESGSGLLSINYLVYQYPTECDLSLSTDNSKQVLILTPKAKRNNLGIVRLSITEENLIDKVIVSNQATGTMEVFFNNYKLNQNLSDSKFTFTSPEGTTVVDLR